MWLRQGSRPAPSILLKLFLRFGEREAAPAFYIRLTRRSAFRRLIMDPGFSDTTTPPGREVGNEPGHTTVAAPRVAALKRPVYVRPEALRPATAMLCECVRLFDIGVLTLRRAPFRFRRAPDIYKLDRKYCQHFFCRHRSDTENKGRGCPARDEKIFAPPSFLLCASGANSRPTVARRNFRSTLQSSSGVRLDKP